MSSSRRPSKGGGAGFPALAAGPLPFLPPKPAAGPAAAPAARGRVASSGGGAGGGIAGTRGGGDAAAGDASITQQQQQQQQQHHHQHQQMLWQTIHSSDGIPALAELHSLQASLQATRSAAEARKKALAGCEAHLQQQQQQQQQSTANGRRNAGSAAPASGDAARTL